MKTLPSKKLFKSALLSPALVLLLMLTGCTVPGVPISGLNTSTGSPTSTSLSAAPTRNDSSNTNNISNPSNPSNPNNPGNPSPADTPTVGVAKMEHALSSNPPVTFRYAGIDFTVKKALITNELPHFQGQYSGTDATIYLTLSGTNENTDNANISSGLLDLKLGSEDYKKPIDAGIQSRDTQSIDFEWDSVPLTTTWTSAQLNINQEDKEPVTVDLNNPQPSQFPIKLTPGPDVMAGTSPITYSVTLAQIGLDGIASNSLMQQVDQGSRFVTIKFSVTNPSSTRDVFVGSDGLTLRADNKPVKDDWLDPASDALGPLKTDKLTAWFVVPAATKNLVFEVGPPDAPSQISLAMP